MSEATPSATTSATDELWHRLAHGLRRFLQSQLGDPELAEDVLQEVFLTLHTHRERLPEIERIDAWLFRVARNAAIDQLRRRRPIHALDEAGPLVDTAVEAPDGSMDGPDPARMIGAWLGSRIQSLPPRYREVLELTELGGLSQRAVAAQLGMSHSTVKSRVQRGRDLLHADLLRCCEVELDARRHVTGFRPRRDPCECGPAKPCAAARPVDDAGQADDAD